MDINYQNLLSQSLKYLGYRPRSRKEIVDFLGKKTSDQNLINQILDQLTKLKLVNDSEFSDWLVKSRSRNRGSIFIKHDLKKRGVDSDSIQVNDLEIAINLLSKKTFADYQKAYRYLAYRGIPSGVIAQAWKKVYNKRDVS